MIYFGSVETFQNSNTLCKKLLRNTIYPQAITLAQSRTIKRRVLTKFGTSRVDKRNQGRTSLIACRLDALLSAYYPILYTCVVSIVVHLVILVTYPVILVVSM